MVPTTFNAPESVSAVYLSHHPVLKDSSTTQLRVVFNASSKTSNGTTLNDHLMVGPKLQSDLPSIILRWRQHRYALTADITKMYRQIAVDPEDTRYQQILWRVTPDAPITPFRLVTVTYGTALAPYLAMRVLQQLADKEEVNFPNAATIVRENFYVDDVLFGANDELTAQSLRHELEQLLDRGGFTLRKWMSSHSSFLKDIPVPDQKKTKNLCMGGGFPLAKWHATHPDVLTAVQAAQRKTRAHKSHLTIAISSHTDHFTKRLVLSEVAQIFDPLGFASPVVIKAKMLLQELWLHKLQWDEPLPSQLSSRWLIIRKELTSLRKISIPRWYNTWSTSSMEFHGFSDASQLAMAVVVFITVHGSNGATISLVCSKTKVAPLKRLTIPRLELTAALLLLRLMQYVQATLKLNVTATHLWTDSVVTLTWIKSHALRWKDFVKNRVSQIQELTANAHWKYVPGTSNPADCASRGLSTAQLQSHSLWWTGPPWILTPEAWPLQPALLDELSAHEARPGIALHAAASQPDYHWGLIYRFISLLGKGRCKPLDLHSALEKARLFWIKATQAAYFTHEIKMLTANSRLPTAHAFSRLTACIDAQGIIRVGGRLNQSALAQDNKHQRRIRAHQLMGQQPLFRVTPSRPFTHTGVDYAGPLTIKAWKGRGAKTYKGWICRERNC
ncbi:uncharacterized protein LOC143898910 [Temnothorax americanus]|uniref:uncharacterized protein LOC143898910 n=1 Tax=Temnothorax americanus TaxID=1964332 RepID=UPI004068587C